MSLYNATKDKKKLKEAQKRLHILYAKIPETRGCLENINKENGCKAWCCEEQTPQVLYVEFLNSWTYILKNFTTHQISALIESCLKKYLFAQENSACVFFDKNSRICAQHDSRPYNCRIYGITPDEEFKPRFERLRVIYPHIKNQCNLVETKSGEVVTKKDIDNWWAENKSIEMSIGIKNDTVHDSVGGSYRTYHDHILLHILGEEGLEYLTYYRLNGTNDEKDIVIAKTVENFIKYMKA